MAEILTRAGCFVAIILMGFVLRRVGFFKKEDFSLLSKIVIKITLTAAIVKNFSGQQIRLDMFVLPLIGFFFGILMMAAGYLLAKPNRFDRSFAVLNSAGCNIGNFALPFAQGFLGPVSVMAVSLFDTGNAFICLGGAFGVAGMVREGNGKFSAAPVLRALFSSVPLITYILMTVLTALQIRLPGAVTELAGIIGNSNAFLAMLMIGVGFQLGGNWEQMGKVLRILGPRYLIGISCAAACFLLPLPLAYRQGLVIAFLSPIASAAPAFTAQMGGDYGLASAINSISIVTSIVLILCALPLVL